MAYSITDGLPDNHYDGSVTKLPGLRSYLDERNPYLEYIKEMVTDAPPGADITGVLQARQRVIYKLLGLDQLADRTTYKVNPQRLSLDGVGGDIKRDSVNPIAFSVYYLYYAGNILLKGKHPDYTDDEWVEKQIGTSSVTEDVSITEDAFMYDYFHTIDSSDTFKPMIQPGQPENINTQLQDGSNDGLGFIELWGQKPDSAIDPMIRETWKYSVKEGRFENCCYLVDTLHWPMKELPNDDREHPSEQLYGPKDRTAHEPYCGYVAFPVGQMGVMWKMALLTHSMIAKQEDGFFPYNISASTSGVRPSGAVFHCVDYETQIEAGGALLPPFTLATSEVPGQLLIDKGWGFADDVVVHFPAGEFEGVDNWAGHYWLRYWITKDNTEIVPGEFVGLVCKPWPLHAWFFQKSSPFIYAGTWVETEFYTCGTVKCVLEKWIYDNVEAKSPAMPGRQDGDTEAYYDAEDMDYSVGGKLYVVWVKGEEMIVGPSDWKEYEAKERVGLLKCVWDASKTAHLKMDGETADENPGPRTNFDWQGLEWKKLKGRSTPDEDIFTKDWVIVPVAFFPAANTYPTMSGS